MILKKISLILHPYVSATLCSQPAESVPGIEIINLLLDIIIIIVPDCPAVSQLRNAPGPEV